MIITCISDTHTKHRYCRPDLPGGDLLIHAGDISSMGYEHEIQQFCKWFNSIENYDHKVFIAGNHDYGFQDNVDKVSQIVNSYKWITYLQDEMFEFGSDYDSMVKIYGSPWQPEFHDWAFNLPRRGTALQSKWDAIPNDTDILITHGPAQGYLDTSGEPYNQPNLGCELLTNRIKSLKPKIHVCGHIHGGYGYKFDGDTHFINASILNERYEYKNKPITFAWDVNTNEVIFKDPTP